MPRRIAAVLAGALVATSCSFIVYDRPPSDYAATAPPTCSNATWPLVADGLAFVVGVLVIATVAISRNSVGHDNALIYVPAAGVGALGGASFGLGLPKYRACARAWDRWNDDAAPLRAATVGSAK